MVLTYDLGKMNLDEAIIEVKELGDGWRLPTIEEFKNILYPNKSKIPNIKDDFYWSSMEYASDAAWYFSFYYEYAYFTNKNDTLYVRAVKTFNGEAALELLLKDFQPG